MAKTRAKKGNAYIGTSGWNYDGWKSQFYEGVPRKDWLSYCGERFTGIEINGSFYRTQSIDSFKKWAGQTPSDFRFTMKGHRFITHNKKLKIDEAPIEREREAPQKGMGYKLAAVVWQLPGSLKFNLDKLENFCEMLKGWPDTRHAIEFRHSSWFNNDAADVLSKHKVAVCMSDSPQWPLWDAVTTDMVYVRLHGHTRLYASKYSDSLLADWAKRTGKWLAEGRDVHVYFDNDSEGAAPIDALRLLDKVKP